MAHTNFDVVRISLASPQDILSWSKGEVKKPETINYRTFRPERDGLFCERIFGPTKDYECQCGKYKKAKYQGIVCEKCGVEVTRSRVRRRRMGHIQLAAPVAHIWYVKNTPSPIALLLDMSPRVVEKVIYFALYIVTFADPAAIRRVQKDVERAAQEEIDEIEEHLKESVRPLRAQLLQANQPASQSATQATEEAVIRVRELERQIQAEERAAQEKIDEIRTAVKLFSSLQKKQTLTDGEKRSLDALMEIAQRKLNRKFSDLFRAEMGAEAVKKLLEDVDLDRLARELRHTIQNTTGSKRARAIKRLEIVEAFRKSKNRPEWMILDVLPVLPPDLRPMVQLDGGRFATSDLNDLYRRIINRNNRLKKIMDIKAPESIINHEKRLLQEAVDALIDNGRKARPVLGANSRPLKSLSDMLKGKEGRFRRNLLGKRVDYSGRSVIVVGPHLKLNQCGIPRLLAKELFRPFIMRWLEENTDFVHNIKGARRVLEGDENPLIWQALEEVVKDHPVLLNRAPTLHRLGVQAFEPVLVDGKAIQIHPLVCPPFNADFDGDQMAVHVPLSVAAQAESRLLMMATNNIFSPANGQPLMSPAYDMVLGCHYLTQLTRLQDELKQKPDALPQTYDSAYDLLRYARNGWVHLSEEVTIRQDGKMVTDTAGRILLHYLGGKGRAFTNPDTAIAGFEFKNLDLHEDIIVWWGQGTKDKGQWVLTTPGRIIFNRLLPDGFPFINEPISKGKLRDIVTRIYREFGNERLIKFLDDVKELGFRVATFSGISLCLTDLNVKTRRGEILKRTDEEIERIDRAHHQGLLTGFERDEVAAHEWLRAREEIADDIIRSIDRFNPLYMMADSGARGRKEQIVQLSGMRGLATTALGTLIHDLPIKSNFHQGLPLLEYFVSTFSSRRSLADTALRTADAGYLTRRLVDVAQDVIIKARDCGTLSGFEITPIYDEGGEVIATISDRIWGRVAAEPVVHPRTKRVLVERNELITEEKAKEIERLGIERVVVRSPLTCELPQGICALCYGMDLSSGKLVEVGEAVGIIAAESIGEPGTQFTMRTFHTVIGKSIVEIKQYRGRRERALQMIAQMTQQQPEMDLPEMLRIIKGAKQGAHEEEQKEQRMKWWVRLHVPRRRGLLRVEELFDVRRPLGQAIVTDYDGVVHDISKKGIWQVFVDANVPVEDLDRHTAKPDKPTFAKAVVHPRTGKEIVPKGAVLSEEVAEKIRKAGVKEVVLRLYYVVPFHADFTVKPGQKVSAGDPLTEGAINPHSLLALKGVRAVQDYLLREIQMVYRSHGLDINDKHIEIIIRQMLRKRKIKDPGDTDFLPGQLVDRAVFQRENERVRKKGGKEATAEWVLMGIMRAAENTDSWLSAASFQRTTQALTDAAIKGKPDYLIGLKENVIIGRLIPAGTGFVPLPATELLAEPSPFALPEPMDDRQEED